MKKALLSTLVICALLSGIVACNERGNKMEKAVEVMRVEVGNPWEKVARDAQAIARDSQAIAREAIKQRDEVIAELLRIRSAKWTDAAPTNSPQCVKGEVK
jgi:hypothetical protein